MARPEIVCLCGSTRFIKTFKEVNLALTLEGKIVLSIGCCDMQGDAELFKGKTENELNDIKAGLDVLHYAKIRLADRIHVLNVGGYIGESTRREIQYARACDKKISYYLVSKYKKDNQMVCPTGWSRDIDIPGRPVLDGEKPQA